MRIWKSAGFSTPIVLVMFMVIAALYGVPNTSAQVATTIVLTGTSGQTINPGAKVSSGYQASIANPNSTDSFIDSTSDVSLAVSVACPSGKSQHFTVPLPSASISIPAGSGAHYPSTPISGTGNAPSNLCGGKAGTINGLTLTATNGVTCHSNSAQGCCHTICNDSFNPKSNSCKSFKSCVSGQKGGCCK